MHPLFGTVLAAALLPGAPAPKEKPDPDPLLGRWEATGMHFDGQPSDSWRGLEYEFQSGGKYVIRVSGKDRASGGPRTYATDPKADPKAQQAHIDLAVGNETSPALYRVKNDELTVSFRYEGGGPRPPDLKPRSGHMTITFKRVPKGK